jgi:hypothetical protein
VADQRLDPPLGRLHDQGVEIESFGKRLCTDLLANLV